MTTLAERIEEALCNCCPTDRDAILADVRELDAAAHNTIVMANTVIACYERNPGNFAMAMREMKSERDALNAILSKTKGST